MIRNGEYPPNIEQIVEVFPRALKPGVIFAYGIDIYNPTGKPVPAEIVAHEQVHQTRQIAMGVESWWGYYLRSPEFRYHEELLAHVEEFKTLAQGMMRNLRRVALKHVAKRLSAPLYEYDISFERAKADIKKLI